ncbi:MAG TPA: NUDIX domain-containing protein [Propionibacteriaceae bacterium]|nr:NUDIX domain-containing protein [Propionibacteriaceae bacterium]
MGIAPHIARLRASVGHDLLLLPSAAVLPVDDEGRVLLARQRDFGLWGTVGGAIDVDESPADAARREAREEIGVEVELTALLGALGGPRFHLTYPNGDHTAYVSVVYQARIVSGVPTPDDDETTELRWFARDELRSDPELHPFAVATFEALGWIS